MKCLRNRDRLSRAASRRRLADQQGQLVAKRRISDGAEGFAALLEMLAETGGTEEDPVPVAIETPARSACRRVALHRSTGACV